MRVLPAAGMLLRIFVGRPTKFGKPFRLLTFGLDPSLSHLDEKSASLYRAAPVKVAV
jgi:hypothetical protein